MIHGIKRSPIPALLLVILAVFTFGIALSRPSTEKTLEAADAVCYEAEDRKDYAAMIKACGEALRISEELHGRESVEAALRRFTLSLAFSKNGEYDRAIACHEETLSIQLKVLGEDNAYVGNTNNKIGLEYAKKGEYDKAIDYYGKALAIYQKVFGELTPDVPIIYSNIGNAYEEKGEYGRAIENYEKALALSMKILGDDHLTVALINNNTGTAYQKKGEYDRAMAYHRKALAIRVKALGESNPAVALSYNNIGVIHAERGEYDAAIAEYEKALAIQLRQLGATHPDVARSYNNIGHAYDNKGEYDKAIGYYEKALAIDLKVLGETHPTIALRYNNIGSAYQKKGKHDKAIGYYEKALSVNLKVFGSIHPSIALSYNNLGVSFATKREYDKAIAYYKKALSVNLKVFGTIHPSIALSYNNLGVSNGRKGEHNKAICYYKKALSVDLEIFGEIHPSIALCYNNLAMEYYRKKRYARAIGYYQKALEISEKTGDRQTTIGIAANLGILNMELKNPDEASASFSAAVNVIESARVEIGAEKTEFMERNIRYYYYLLKSKALMGNLEGVFDTAERMRARGFLDRLSLSAALSAEGVEEGDASRMIALNDEIASLASRRNAEINRLSEKRDSKKLLSLSDELLRKEREFGELDQKLMKNERYRSLRHPRGATLDEAKKLAGNRAILEYVIWEEKDPRSKADAHRQSYCMVITGAGANLVPLDRDFDYTGTVMKYRDALIMAPHLGGFGLGDADPDRLGALLYEKLLVPVEKHIGGAKGLVIIPDGALAFLPFDSLRKDPAGEYLCEQYEVSLAPSVSVMLMVQGREFGANRRAMLAFGGGIYSPDGASAKRGRRAGVSVSDMPEKEKKRLAKKASAGATASYYNGRGIRWENLPGTGEEVARIDSLVYGKKGTMVVTGEDVTEERVKALSKTNELARYRTLHFACHGYYDREFPSYSAVVFSEVSRKMKTGEDGYLSVEEVALLKLEAEIVNLSACETGLGKVVKGDGVVGLTRAFQVAGANRVGVTLWQVDDEATMEFMVRVYSRVVKERMDFGAAYRATKREFIMSKEYEQYRSPYFWSGFILYGE